MGFTISKDIELEEDEVIDMIVEDSDNNYLLEIIKRIDAKVSDWDFTRDLVKHFLTDLVTNEEDEEVEELFKSFGYVKVKSDDDDEEEEDEDEDDDEEDEVAEKVEDHNHIFRDGTCWCGSHLEKE